jgi:hypothetical protein
LNLIGLSNVLIGNLLIVHFRHRRSGGDSAAVADRFGMVAFGRLAPGTYHLSATHELTRSGTKYRAQGGKTVQIGAGRTEEVDLVLSAKAQGPGG